MKGQAGGSGPTINAGGPKPTRAHVCAHAAYHGDEADEIGCDRLPTGEHGERDCIHRATLVGINSRPLAAAAALAVAAAAVEIGLFERAD